MATKKKARRRKPKAAKKAPAAKRRKATKKKAVAPSAPAPVAKAAPAPKRKHAKAPVARVRRRRRKAGHGRLEIALAVPPHIAIDGAELEGLNPSQRLELAALAHKKTTTPPSFIADEALWLRAVRSVRSHWSRYEYPYAAALLVYQRLGGTVSSHAAAHKPAARRAVGQA